MVVERVVGQVALVDARPQVALGPGRERVVLPDRALGVPLDEPRVRAGRRLLAADAGDPRLRAVERALQRGDLRVAAAVLGAPRAHGVLHLDLDAEALLEGAPGAQRLGEEHAGVDRHDARVRARSARSSSRITDSSFWKEHRQHELLVLGRPWLRACAVRPRTRPRPRCTTKGTLRSQSMKCSIVSRPNSTGSASSRTSSSKALVPTRAGEGVELLAVRALALVEADPALDRLGHALGGQPDLQPLAVDDLAALVVAGDVRDVGRDRVLADLDRRAVEADVGDVVLAAAVRAAAHLDVDARA